MLRVDQCHLLDCGNWIKQIQPATAPVRGCSLYSAECHCAVCSIEMFLSKISKGRETCSSQMLSPFFPYVLPEREYTVLLGKGRLKVFWNFCFGWFVLGFFLLLWSVGGEGFFEGIEKVFTTRRGGLSVQAFRSELLTGLRTVKYISPILKIQMSFNAGAKLYYSHIVNMYVKWYSL